MSTAAKPTSVVERSRDLRERLRDRGYREITVWVPDVGTSAFRLEARRQSQAVASGRDDQDFIDAVSDWPGG